MQSMLRVPEAEEAVQTVALFDLLPQQHLRPFGNAQSFHSERGHLYFILTTVEPSGAARAVIVRSDAMILPYSIPAIQEEGFYPLASNINLDTHQLIPPSVLARWSRQSVQAFLLEETWKSTPAELFQTLTAYLERFIYHEDARVLRFLALFTMVSYVHTLFEALPLVLITGERETAKTRTAEIVSELAFNGRLRGSLTPAILARQIQRDQPLLCIDESEDLAKGRRGQEIFRLLRAMYRRSGSREVCGVGGASAVFHLFCPVVLVNILGVDDALRDRIIELHTVPRARQVERFLLHQQSAALQRLRDELYRFACAHASHIYETYITFPGVPTLSDRVEELWLPVFVLAKVIDETAAHSALLTEMVRFARELCEQKREEEQFAARDSRIVVGLYFFLQDQDMLGHTRIEVNANALTHFIREVEGLDALRSEEVSRVLGRAKVISQRFRRRVRVNDGSTKPLVHYHINAGRLLEMVKRLGLLEPT